MGKNSAIAWTDHSFNPWIGCTKVGPGCDNCYAEKERCSLALGVKWGQGEARHRTAESTWRNPRHWNDQAEKSGVRQKVFCASLADVFDNEVPQEWRDDLFALIRETPMLDWIILTKRIGNVREMLPVDWDSWHGYPNVWLLITVVNQDEANRDIPKLLDIPAQVRGVSIEPQIGPVDLENIPYTDTDGDYCMINALEGELWVDGFQDPDTMEELDWVICGSESGPNRRPFDIAWARELRKQCWQTQTPFFLKQTPGDTRKGVIETPELDGRRWTQYPEGAGE